MHQLQSWHNCVVLQTTMTIAKMATMWMLHNLWLRNSLELSKKMLEHFVLDLPAQKRKFRCMMQQFSWPAVWENLQITGKHSDPSWAARNTTKARLGEEEYKILSLSLCPAWCKILKTCSFNLCKDRCQQLDFVSEKKRFSFCFFSVQMRYAPTYASNRRNSLLSPSSLNPSWGGRGAPVNLFFLEQPLSTPSSFLLPWVHRRFSFCFFEYNEIWS